MSWHVQCTVKRRSWLAVLPLALALVACGGSMEGDSVTGPSGVALSTDSVTSDALSASGKSAKVLLCHKGGDKWVSSSAVSGHLRHGDSLGSCSAPELCPCFSASGIQAAASECSSTVTNSCSNGEPYSLFLGCDPGGSVPPAILGIYLTQTAGGGFCSRDDGGGNFEQMGLTSAEYQACVDAINTSGFCF